MPPPASGGRYGIETKFTRAVRDLAGRFEHRLFLSATPHNGHSNSFSTLLELLDPYRFTRGVKVRGKRRSKTSWSADLRKTFERSRVVSRSGTSTESRSMVCRTMRQSWCSRVCSMSTGTREETVREHPSRAQAAAGLLVVGLSSVCCHRSKPSREASRCTAKTVERHWEKAQEPADGCARWLRQPDAALHLAPDADDERAQLDSRGAGG